MTEFKIIKTTDFITIQRLAKEIWQQHYVPIIGQAQVDYMLEKFYTPFALAEQSDGGQDFWLLLDETQKAIGYLGMSQGNKEGTYFLNKFYINPEEQGKGLGAQVFYALIDQYKGLETIHLQVNIDNYKSINFYFKMGFKIKKRYILDIGNDYIMNDYIMAFQVLKRPNP